MVYFLFSSIKMKVVDPFYPKGQRKHINADKKLAIPQLTRYISSFLWPYAICGAIFVATLDNWLECLLFARPLMF